MGDAAEVTMVPNGVGERTQPPDEHAQPVASADASGATEGAALTDETFATRLAEGKEKERLGEFEEAANIFGEILEFMTQKHGEIALETAEMYFLYGDSLLSSFESKPSDVLGDNIPQEAQKGESSSSLEADSSAAEPAGDSANAGDDDDDDDDEDEQGGGGGAEQEEDLTTLDLAFQVLDTARSIYEKAGDGHELKLAEVYLRLGDHSQHTENKEQGQHDYEESIKLRTQLLPVHDRRIAEAHYMYGTYHSVFLDGDVLGHLRNAIAQFELALASIRSRITLKSEEGSDAARNEVAELQDLVAEINEKVNDCRDQQKQHVQIERDQKLASARASSSTTTTIGFGQPSTSSSTQPSSTTTIGFGASSSSAVPTIGSLRDSEAVELRPGAVKRKRVVLDSSDSSSSQPASQPAHDAVPSKPQAVQQASST